MKIQLAMATEASLYKINKSTISFHVLSISNSLQLHHNSWKRVNFTSHYLRTTCINDFQLTSNWSFCLPAGIAISSNIFALITDTYKSYISTYQLLWQKISTCNMQFTIFQSKRCKCRSRQSRYLIQHVLASNNLNQTAGFYTPTELKLHWFLSRHQNGFCQNEQFNESCRLFNFFTFCYITPACTKLQASPKPDQES
jgi:hypothetical protein